MSIETRGQQRYQGLAVRPLEEKDIPEAIGLWTGQFENPLRHAGRDASTVRKMKDAMSTRLRTLLGEKKGRILSRQNKVVGYLSWETFPFHGEPTAFVPIWGHASADVSYKDAIYGALYRDAAEEWVSQGVLSHIFSYLTGDTALHKILYELGFGLIVVDAFRLPDSLPDVREGIEIRELDKDGISDVEILGPKARDFYAEAPMFLKKQAFDEDDVENHREMIGRDDCVVYIAYADGTAAGFMSFSSEDSLDEYTLAYSSMGAYIRPEYRGMGIGKALLQKCVEWCQQKRIAEMHVDFESANLYGNRFWRKYFSPFINSVKRQVNLDILEPAHQQRSIMYKEENP